MALTHRIAAGLAAAALIVVVTLILHPRQDTPGPHLTGWMQNFTPATEPRPAPQTGFTGRDGRSLTLAGFRGRVVLVNFWATWCLPCIRELPTLARLQAKLGGDGFTVVLLSLDREGWPVIAPFLDRLKLDTLPVYHDTGGLTARALGLKGLPSNLLIDRAGNEIGRLAGPAEWDSDEAVALMRYYIGR